MLKKTLKKLIATALAVATVATTMVAPVSASTLTPKKSHSKAEITEFVDYFNEITDRYSFLPNGYVPTYIEGNTPSTASAYSSWQMTVMLQNTPGITSEQKADMKKAAAKWKKAYVSECMIYTYWVKWQRMYRYIDDKVCLSTSKSWAPRCKAYAKKMYNEANTYISGKSKYNPKLANELKKFNKQRFNTYNKAIDTWFYKMSKKQRAKYGSNIVGGGANGHSYALMTCYVDSCFTKKKMSSDPHCMYTFIAVDGYGDDDHYATQTLKIHSYDLNPNGPFLTWAKHIRPLKTW